jgi:hypothetical protein
VFISDVKFYFVTRVQNILFHNIVLKLSTQHLRESKHIAAVVSAKDRPVRQFLIGEFSAARYSSGPSKFSTFAADLCKAFVSADT